MSLTGKTKANTYKDVLIVPNSNNGIDSTTRNITSGDGTASAISISDDRFTVQPINDDTSTALFVRSQSGTPILAVDTANSVVRVGIGQHTVNTQYAHFGVSGVVASAYAANTHYPISFENGFSSAIQADVDFGTGGDPDTTFTTADTDTQYASQLVPMMWRVSDNITIDEIKHLEGADAATGDTTRMHLMSYTFTSGATACLTSGAVVANTSADNTNAGNEQPYLKDWTIGTEDIDAGKVLLCFFRSDSINSDYSVSVTIKYHLR